MSTTIFTDLPDLVLLHILRYLSPFDAIQAFYDVDSEIDRMINLLIEARCFSCLHQFPVPLFEFICDRVLPRMGARLTHLTLHDHHLRLAREKQILSALRNLSSIRLKINAVVNEPDLDLDYYLHPQLEDLTLEFHGAHHRDAQAFVCEQFLCHMRSEHLKRCQLWDIGGIQLRYLDLAVNHSLEALTIQLRCLADLHLLWDHFPNLRMLNVELRHWSTEDVKYDYRKLSTELVHLTDFTLKSDHTLSFNLLLTIIEHMIHLKKLSFIYRNYDEHGIDLHRFERALNNLTRLTDLHFLIRFVYFQLSPKLAFNDDLRWQTPWKIQSYVNPIHKTYVVHTRTWPHLNACEPSKSFDVS